MIRAGGLARTLIVFWCMAVVVPVMADWTATGTVHYTDREFDQTGFTGVEPALPIRFADVEIVDNGTGLVLASGATDGGGGFSVDVVDAEVRDVYVRVLSNSTGTSDLNLKVTDAVGVSYSIAGAVLAGHDPAADVHLGFAVAAIGAGGEAFNLFDQGVLGADYLAFLQGSRPGSGNPLTMVWEAARGQAASTTITNRIDVRDTGAYDDTVTLHEYGHYAVKNFADNDNPGGSHALADCNQNMALAWDEGHASFFGNSILRHFGLARPNIYVATTGGAGAGHMRTWFDLETEVRVLIHLPALVVVEGALLSQDHTVNAHFPDVVQLS